MYFGFKVHDKIKSDKEDRKERIKEKEVFVVLALILFPIIYDIGKLCQIIYFAFIII